MGGVVFLVTRTVIAEGGCEAVKKCPPDTWIPPAFIHIPKGTWMKAGNGSIWPEFAENGMDIVAMEKAEMNIILAS